MTEETIISAIVLNQKYKLTAKERAAKAILEQHEAEMVEFSEFAYKFNKHYDKHGEAVFDDMNLIDGDQKYSFYSYSDLLTLFKNRNK